MKLSCFFRLFAFLAVLGSMAFGLAPVAKAQAITPLGSFTGAGNTNGQTPMGGVVLDAAGNLYGTTDEGGANNDGTVYKIAPGTNTPLTVASFIFNVGVNPWGQIAIDTAGDIFGTAQQGGSDQTYNKGTVWELPHGSNALRLLATFIYSGAPGDTHGSTPFGGVTLDAAGNLFGTTYYGGSAGLGTVWELPAGASSIQTLASFDGTGNTGDSNGFYPYAGVTLDPAGNLYGTTAYGGTSNNGTVWKLAPNATAVTTVAQFNGANGSYSVAGVVLDAAGNIYGSAQNGGPTGKGTVFEIPANTSTINVSASFSTYGPENPNGVILDGQGNLFGTTFGGGTGGVGTIFEVIKGATSATTLASFNSTNGAYPNTSLTIDSQGDLFGATQSGGTGGYGEVFEISGVATPPVATAPPVPTGLSLMPNPARADTTINGTVTFSQSVPAGTSVTITSNGALLGAVSTPLAGSSLGFTLPLSGYVAGTYTIGAVLNSKSATQSLSVTTDRTKPVPTSIVFSPNPVTPNATTTATVTLSAAAPPGGLTVYVYSGSAYLGAVTVAAGSKTTTFTESNPAGSYPFQAIENGVQVTTNLTVSTPATGHVHLLWTNTSGAASLWTISPSGSPTISQTYGPYSGWNAKAVSDEPSGTTHILWTNTSGQIAVWNLQGGVKQTEHDFGPFPGYHAVSLSTGGDDLSHVLWNKTSGAASLWSLNTSSGAYTYANYGPFPGWTASAVASGNEATDLLWVNTSGQASGWKIASDGTYQNSEFGAYSHWAATALSVGSDDAVHLLWDNTAGNIALWNVDFGTGAFMQTGFGPFGGWTAKAVATGSDGVTHLLWSHSPDGQVSLWALTGGSYTHAEYGPYSGWTVAAVSAGP